MLKNKFVTNDIISYSIYGNFGKPAYFKVLERKMGSGVEYYQLYRFDRGYIVNYPVVVVDNRAELFICDEKMVKILYGKKV